VRVLVCDDSPLDQQIARAALSGLGHEAVVVESGEAALDALRGEDAPRVLLLDWVLPSADGLTVCRRVREECREGYVYTVVVTGRQAKADVTAAFEAGADDFIQKPLDPLSLAARLHAGERILTLEERLQSEAVMRERFIGILGHDLRQPLDAIILTAELLMQRPHARPGPASLDEHLERIARSGRRMSVMIEELLDFTRGRLGGGIPIHPAPDDLRGVCQRTIDELGVVFADRTVELASHGDTSGRWDGERLAEVVTNLLANACRYSPSDTVVHVCVDGRQREQVALEVTNRCAPIPPDLAAQIFDPFRRGEDRVSAPGGLGLGLYIAREIARAHRGTLTLRNNEGGTTTFRVSLPRASAGAPERPDDA
jgi:signal transduction histidine kinase